MALAMDRPIWGWDGPARLGLVLIAGLMASALLMSAPRQNIEPAPRFNLVADPNRVPEAVLGALPGLGPALSRRIVEGRADGFYASVADLDRRVKGIGPTKAQTLEPFLRFPPVNAASAGLPSR